ncbi:hypothetical protein B0H19DRAFT_1074400 [Mycena capillaripes]|nr:hypothetical protein B0H19DRAFT_1074400 [Mycena capillaripes]
MRDQGSASSEWRRIEHLRNQTKSNLRVFAENGRLVEFSAKHERSVGLGAKVGSAVLTQARHLLSPRRHMCVGLFTVPVAPALRFPYDGDMHHSRWLSCLPRSGGSHARSKLIHVYGDSPNLYGTEGVFYDASEYAWWTWGTVKISTSQE